MTWLPATSRRPSLAPPGRGAWAGLAVAALGALAGCGSDVEEQTVAKAADAVETVHSEGQLLAGVADFDVVPPSATEAALRAAARTPTLYSPAGCMTVAVSGAEATYTLEGCSGPRGLSGVTGVLAVTYAVDLTGLSTEATASRLEVNGSTLVALDARSTYSVSGATHKLAVASTAQSTGPRGTAFTHDGSYAIAWSTARECLALAGDWTTTTAAKRWATGVNGYARCAGTCPIAGADEVFDDGTADAVTIHYDGTSTAAWTSAGGKQGKLQLACGG